MNQHRYTCPLHPERPSYVPPHPVPLGCPGAPALGALPHASNSPTGYGIEREGRCFLGFSRDDHQLRHGKLDV